MNSAILLLLSLFIAACGSSDPNQPANNAGPVEQAKAAPAMPADFVFEIGEGGGFSGAWQITRVTADGDVLQDDVKKSTVPKSTREALWKLVLDAGFFSMESKPGNMSTAITVIADGKATHVAREMHSEGADEFQKLAADCRAVIANADKPLD